MGDVLTADVEITSQTESKRAYALLQRAFPETREAQERDISEVVVVRATGGAVAGPAVEKRVQQLSRELHAAGATEVITSADGASLVSRDGDARAVLVGLGFDGEDDEHEGHPAEQHGPARRRPGGGDRLERLRPMPALLAIGLPAQPHPRAL